ncbi:MAG: ATP-dependent helicase [Omnitrophica bacterium]|nr:ATP-dependent helicase [Candidatus Omnitrophota bacterium]
MKYTIKLDSPVGLRGVDYKKDLNREQYEVVTEAEGPCLVLAGAGSGKTRTLIYRVAYLLEKGIPAKNILLVTFTNKAARNMKDRIEALFKAKPKGLWSGTFHHIGNRSLRLFAKESGYKQDFGILDEEDSLDLLKVCIKNLKIKTTEERFPQPRVLRSIISLSVNSGKTLEDVLKSHYPYFLRFYGSIKKINQEYDARKRASNNMDYDDLLTKWLWLLRNSQSAKDRFSKQFRYVLVDEYQDTNYLQSEIVRELSIFHKNVLVVGDDAQSIYSFRGADVTNILRFPKGYPDARIFKLESNYRSSPEILDLANDSISHNENQFKKHLRATNESRSKPALVEVRDHYAQGNFVAQRVLELRDEGVGLSEIAVLFRAHYQSAELQMELTKRDIPFVVRGGMRFFEQAHIKDVLAYVKILINPFDEISWLRALSTYPGIGPAYAGRIFDEFSTHGDLRRVVASRFGIFLPERTRSGLRGFKKIIRAILDGDLEKKPDEVIMRILEAGYENYAMTHFDNSKDRLDDLRELVNFAHTYKSTKTLLQDITLRESFKGETINGALSTDEHLVLSTIHQAKGLEWKAIFVIGLCDGQFPHAKCKDDPAQFEEERRLFYVATTRTKQELYLLHPITRYDYHMGTVITRKSLFLEELSQDLYDRWDVEEEFTEDYAIDLDRG